MSYITMASKKCRTAESSDFAIYIIADIGATFFKMVSDAESKKKEGNMGTILGAEIGRLICSLLKNEVNKDLCAPLGFPRNLSG